MILGFRVKHNRRFLYWALNLIIFLSCTRSCESLSARLICSHIPGLSPAQRHMCQIRPDMMVAVGNGVTLGVHECRHQFRSHRWNCSDVGTEAVFGRAAPVSSREVAYMYAITSAGVTYSVTQSCSRGNVSRCGCDRTKAGFHQQGGWKWGGCSADVRYGMKVARKFLDAREMDQGQRKLMNMHNNRAGRKAVLHNMQLQCKCHGVSGSCSLRTCWRTLPPFVQIGDHLMKRYHRAKRVVSFFGKTSLIVPKTLNGGQSSKLKKSARMPRPRDLVFIDKSPNYCEVDPSTGSPGTFGRLCDRTSTGTDGCGLMCCGRGYNTHLYTKTWQCNCKFHWCCFVHCNTCSSLVEEYTCK